MKSVLLSTTASAAPILNPGHGNGNGGNGKGRRRRHGRFRNGYRLAALRAYSGAKLVLFEGIDPVEAAVMVGSCPQYVRALVAVVDSHDWSLLDEVLAGRVLVLTAAAQLRGLAKLVKAFATASATTRAAFGRAVGPESLYDTAVVPALAAAE
jgi:hypothetical protein